MEAKHTPGPWFIGSAGRFLICTLTPEIQVYADEMVRTDAVHDARLIAAAPELLDALRAAYSDIQRLPGHTIDMLGRIEAAILKATA